MTLGNTCQWLSSSLALGTGRKDVSRRERARGKKLPVTLLQGMNPRLFLSFSPSGFHVETSPLVMVTPVVLYGRCVEEDQGGSYQGKKM